MRMGCGSDGMSKEGIVLHSYGRRMCVGLIRLAHRPVTITTSMWIIQMLFCDYPSLCQYLTIQLISRCNYVPVVTIRYRLISVLERM
jgi:hypothetical protein